MVAGLLAGCASLPEFGKGGDGKRSGAGEATVQSAAASDELVYFANEDRLNVYAEPSSQSSLIGELELHQKVLRSEVSRGYARIRTEDGRLSGWVDNARLIWRLPGSQATEEPAASAADAPVAAPEEPVPQASESAPVATPAATPSAEAVPDSADKPAPSVFNPF